ncbi:MAG: hypothetical protein HY329_03410, partial [Chloroflexi bacterium]|nr:hypothetical protein [Chloroflexota bacterium]
MSTRTPLSTQYRVPIGRLSVLAGAAVTMLATIAGVFLYVPTERVQGPAQRIFYIHVP